MRDQNKGEDKMRDRNKFRGSLIGGAVGDALGYAVEFLSRDEILNRYGEQGIVEYELTDGVAQISDDTQMTLFTANALLFGATRLAMRGIGGGPGDYCCYLYQDWLYTQDQTTKSHHDAWLINIPELHNRRAPGNTCLSALRAGGNGTIEHPINQSKGCGGIMRVAPIGLYYERGRNVTVTGEDLAMVGAKAAALTHGHDLGYIPAAALVYIINAILYGDYSGEDDLKDIVTDSTACMCELFREKPHIGAFKAIIENAISLAYSDKPDIVCLTELGEGWVAEETLAIAVFCSLRYRHDFGKAIRTSVNHSGDSDSTGSVTGNILGAYLGYDAIPEQYLSQLELKDVILEIADDLYRGCPISEYDPDPPDEIKMIWASKYITRDYAGTSGNDAKLV
jgi:ADP-ribosylglycohydrolase